MKIIAHISGDRYMVEATDDELAQVAGFPSAYHMKDTNKVAVGMAIKVSPLYEALQVSRGRKAEIAELANKLRAAAGRVDSINQALAAPIVEVEVKA